jgi:TolB-like protein
VRLSEGAISANGTVEVDADNTVRGRFAVDLKMSAEQRRANFVISGTLKKIEWRRP